MISARQALERLRRGNRRFAEEGLDPKAPRDGADRPDPADGQHPFAIVLTCADSRVAPEILFDQGLGDLFIVRVAGNILGPAVIGSIEFAAAGIGTRLVVVLGHSHCGAIRATLDQLTGDPADLSPSLRILVDRVRPSIEGLLAAESDPDELRRKAVRANVSASSDGLRNSSELLARLIREEGLLVVGAEYSLDTGVVDFFDGAE